MTAHPHRPSPLLPWFLIFVGALALRLGYGLTRPPLPQQPDAYAFDAIAWHLAQDHTFGDPHPTAGRPPLYPFFLAGVYTVAGHSVPAARIAQAFLGALAVLLLMGIARRLLPNEKAVRAVGVLAALYPFSIYYEASLLSESIVPFLAILMLWCFLRWRERPVDYLRAAAFGLAAAALTLARLPFLMVSALILAVEVFEALSEKLGNREAGALVLAGGLFLGPVGLWGLRNQKAVGRFTLDTHGGYTLMDCVAYYDLNKQGKFAAAWPTLDACQQTMGLSEPAADSVLRGKVREFIRAHPRRYAKQVAANVVDFWRFYPRQDVYFLEGKFKVTLLSLLTEPFLLIGGTIGFWRTRRRWRDLYPIYLSIGVLFLVHIVSCSQMRYRLPLMPFFILMSVAAVRQRLVARSS